VQSHLCAVLKYEENAQIFSHVRVGNWPYMTLHSTVSFLNFHTYEENFLFFFYSALSTNHKETKI